ncbi:hypothetical protein DN752_04325 [Echinicola strongylocentroti]|uniref:Uncharacterized protein n=2 Tax=Echinicola strongylocentroti TaxID=1795355 RepID=A0A2Z4IFF0_9BACT|nr:hypothetical protein DN752_04325 [Echinicola strongylocentroti]
MAITAIQPKIDMKKLIKRLPVLGLALAATAAFAFNMPIEEESMATRVWTPDASQPDGYRDVTAIAEEGNYDCNLSSDECLVEFSNDDPASGTKTILQDGEFEAQ